MSPASANRGTHASSAVATTNTERTPRTDRIRVRRTAGSAERNIVKPPCVRGGMETTNVSQGDEVHRRPSIPIPWYGPVQNREWRKGRPTDTWPGPHDMTRWHAVSHEDLPEPHSHRCQVGTCRAPAIVAVRARPRRTRFTGGSFEAPSVWSRTHQKPRSPSHLGRWSAGVDDRCHLDVPKMSNSISKVASSGTSLGTRSTTELRGAEWEQDIA